VIGLLLAFVFGNQKDGVPFWCLGALNELSTKYGKQSSSGVSGMVATADHTVPLFFVVVSCVWFGTSNAAREIVTERAIYLRERMVNLSLFNYILSKYVLLSIICVIQCTMLLGIVFAILGFNGGPQAFLLELACMIAVSMNAAALGLLLSTVVTSAEAAMALTPIALIPQIVLGGLMVPMTTNSWLKYPMYIMPARWGFQGAITHEREAIANHPAWLIDLKDRSFNNPPDYLYAGKFKCAIAQMGSESLNGAWGFTNYEDYWFPPVVLWAMTLFILVVMMIILKRRDPV
jgi:hypothetical protein